MGIDDASLVGAPQELVVGTLSGTGVARIDVSHDGDWKVSERWSSTDLKPEFPDAPRNLSAPRGEIKLE